MNDTGKMGLPLAGPTAPNWTFGRVVRATLGRFLMVVFRVRTIGIENVPDTGAILAGNHVSHLDPVLLWCAAPRPTHFMAKIELWKTGWLGWLLEQFWAFSVNRAGADREAINTATALLVHGDLVGIFPEGTRKRDGSDEMGAAHGGVAFISSRAEVPVVPVGIVGTESALPAGRTFPRFVPVTISFGPPINPSEFEGSRKEKVAAMTGRIMADIDEQRGRARGA